MNINKDRRGISRMDTVLQTVNEEKSLSLSTDDSSTLSSAATIIQAHIRGFLVRSKLSNNKVQSSLSPADSDGFSGTSLEVDGDQTKGKTVLNIHIVPDRGHFTSRDESMITSVELSLDGSPPTSMNLHPSSCDLTERRKQLKREDAVQSATPPSNSSSKLSEDVDSVREIAASNTIDQKLSNRESRSLNERDSISNEIVTAVEIEGKHLNQEDSEDSLTKSEINVVTPFAKHDNGELNLELNRESLMHSSELHEAVVPTRVSRSDSSVTREFHNVLAFYLLWN
ncbi:uncharacterized protein LOC126972564 [Leptidea sinapis]|uniref:uncharacterized protein LOC126972564 n=1 Tax=Leptidea sinapis TaxID=189913 RepID=UPI0021C2D721|nr:uncharacterized protein LOC126972564 [Leptidea sinapis]